MALVRPREGPGGVTRRHRPAARAAAPVVRRHRGLRRRPVRRAVLGDAVGVVRVVVGPATDDLAALYAVPRTPWLRVNMVGTVDGAATGDSGRSGSINNAVDKVVFDHLRATADVVVVGA